MMNVIFAVLVLGVIAVIFGLVLSVAAKAFEVKVDERLPKIQACLAGANCGGCGYPGCAGCAEAILAGKAPVNACAPAGAEGAAKIAAIMGMEAPSGEKMVAHVTCNGGDAAVKSFEYVGLHDCVAATKVAGGPTACAFGCLGYGTCVAACTATTASSPSMAQDSSRVPLPDVVRDAAAHGSAAPSRCDCAAATDARSAVFCARCTHSSRLPAMATAPSMAATIAISATPDMVPEPSSAPFNTCDTRRTYCFTSCFTEVVPFLPRIGSLSKTVTDSTLS